MKLSKKCEYALLVLISLSKLHASGEVVSATCLSEQNKIPRKFLDQIMVLLKKYGYVKSIRGSAGGFLLGKPPEEISLAEIIRLIDGPIAPIASVSKFFYHNTPSEQNEKLIGLFREIRDYTAQKLESFTLDQFL